MKVVYYNIREKLERVCVANDTYLIKHIELSKDEYKELIELCRVQISVDVMGEAELRSVSGAELDNISFKCEGSTSDVNVNIPYFMGVKLVVERD